MENSATAIPQIKPRSIIDPPQITFAESSHKKGVSHMNPTEPLITPISKDKKTRRRKLLKIFGIVSGVFAVLLILGIIFVGIPAYGLYTQAKVLLADIPRAKEIAKSQDIVQIKGFATEMDKKISAFETSYRRLGWMGIIPFAGAYYKDGSALLAAGKEGVSTTSLLIETIEPYADILGLKGGSGQPTTGGETANDRVEFLLATLNQVLPKLDAISEKLTVIQKNIDTIDANRYPVEFRGKKIRENIVQAQQLLAEAQVFITDGKPLIQKAPYLLGMDSPRTYFVIFQNDKELRPTGGFLTAYSIMKVSKGKPEPVSSSDIYNLDDKYTPQITAPDPFKAYIKGIYVASNKLRLRDMNWSPDFKESMDVFLPEARKAGVGQIDGIIAVDTNVLVKILDVIGPVGVSGFGNFSTQNDSRCNCPQVIYELENYASVEGPVVWDPNTGEIVFAPPNYGKNRKDILGPLMNSVLANTLGQPKAKLPALFQAGWDLVMQKHVLTYFTDPDTQSAGEHFNISGRIKEYAGDYLHISDANLGGRKSNLYVTQEVSQTVEKQKDGSIVKTVDITYKNPQKFDGWLNSILPSWVRIYIPKGSQITSVEGLENPKEPYEELGKTVISGAYHLRPEGVVKIKLVYTLPFKAEKEYSLLIQKQPGLDAPVHSLQVGKKLEEFTLLTDKEFKIAF